MSPSSPTGKSKHVPAPPPRASSSRESSLKYSQTLQREHMPRGPKRDISLHYQTQTLPLPSSKPKQRPLDSPTPLSSTSSTSSSSHASVKYEGLLFKVFFLICTIKWVQWWHLYCKNQCFITAGSCNMLFNIARDNKLLSSFLCYKFCGVITAADWEMLVNKH